MTSVEWELGQLRVDIAGVSTTMDRLDSRVDPAVTP
jgi:hypothetical protein